MKEDVRLSGEFVVSDLTCNLFGTQAVAIT